MESETKKRGEGRLSGFKQRHNIMKKGRELKATGIRRKGNVHALGMDTAHGPGGFRKTCNEGGAVIEVDRT